MKLRTKNEMQHTSANSIADKVRNTLEILIRLVDGDKTFYPNHSFNWIPEVEHHFPEIRRELEQVIHKVDIPAWEDVSGDPNVKVGATWKTYIFCAYGNFVKVNCDRCPETYKALMKIRGMKTAWFSILAPQSRLPEHRGPYNGMLRYHLGLIIPDENPEVCGIRVGSDIRNWKEGKSLVFDDSHLHEVWNLTDHTRVVLFVDIVRPLPFPVSVVNQLAIFLASRSGFIKKLMANLER